MFKLSKRMIIGIIILLIIIFFIIINIKLLWSTFTPFLISIFLAYLIKPAVEFLNKYIKNKSISIAIVFILILFLLIAFIYYLIPIVIVQLKLLLVSIPNYLKVINKWTINLNKYFNNININLNEILIENEIQTEKIINRIIQNVLKYFQNFYSNLINYILVPILVYYFVKDWNMFAKWLRWIIPKKYRKEGFVLIHKINMVIHQYVRAQLLDAFVVGFITFIGLNIFNIKFSLLLAIISGLFNLIPFFGPVIGAIPAVLIALSESWPKALLLILMYIVIQQLDSFLIAPKIVGDKLGLHPVTIIITLIVCSKLFGFISLFFAIPLIAVLKIILISLYESIIKNEEIEM